MKIIKLEIYNQEIVLFTKKDKFKSFCESKGINVFDGELNMNGLTTHQQCGNGENLFLMCVFNGSMSTLVHECIHAADFLFSHLGIPVSVDNSEARAYLTDYIFKESMKLGRFKL